MSRDSDLFAKWTSFPPVVWLGYFIKRLFDTGLTYRAASLVYATLLSLVPLMIVTFTVLSFVPHMSMVGAKIEQYVFQNFVTSAASSVNQALHGFVENMHRLSAVNMVFLFFVCMLMIHNMRCAFNTMWGVREQRNFFGLMLVYLLMLVIGPPVAAILMVGGATIAALPYIHSFTDDAWIKTHLLLTLPWLVTFLVFWFLNAVLPCCKVKAAAAAVGAFVSTVLFELLKFGFTGYVKHEPTYHILYGAVAAIPIFLIWLYLSWIMVLLGAMIAHDLTRGITKGNS